MYPPQNFAPILVFCYYDTTITLKLRYVLKTIPPCPFMTPTGITTHLILKDLYNRQILAWRQNSSPIPLPSGGFRPAAKTGLPDIIAILPPTAHFLGIEIKTGKDRLRPAQIGFKINLEKMGGTYLVVKDFPDYEKQTTDLRIFMK